MRKTKKAQALQALDGAVGGLERLVEHIAQHHLSAHVTNSITYAHDLINKKTIIKDLYTFDWSNGEWTYHPPYFREVADNSFNGYVLGATTALCKAAERFFNNDYTEAVDNSITASLLTGDALRQLLLGFPQDENPAYIIHDEGDDKTLDLFNALMSDASVSLDEYALSHFLIHCYCLTTCNHAASLGGVSNAMLLDNIRCPGKFSKVEEALLLLSHDIASVRVARWMRDKAGERRAGAALADHQRYAEILLDSTSTK